MTIFFYILTALLLVIIRTALIPILPVIDKFYDLLIPIIIYLGFFRPKREGIPVVLFSGYIMDSLCGGPLGLYLIIYIWIYIAVRWVGQFLSAGSFMMPVLAIISAVAFEVVFLLGYMALVASDAKVPADAGKTILMQLIWAMITGPIIMAMIAWAQKRLDSWRKKILADW